MLVSFWYFFKGKKKNTEILKSVQCLIMFVCKRFMELLILMCVMRFHTIIINSFIQPLCWELPLCQWGRHSGWKDEGNTVPTVNKKKAKVLGGLEFIRNKYKKNWWQLFKHSHLILITTQWLKSFYNLRFIDEDYEEFGKVRYSGDMFKTLGQ